MAIFYINIVIYVLVITSQQYLILTVVFEFYKHLSLFSTFFVASKLFHFISYMLFLRIAFFLNLLLTYKYCFSNLFNALFYWSKFSCYYLFILYFSRLRSIRRRTSVNSNSCHCLLIKIF